MDLCELELADGEFRMMRQRLTAEKTALQSQLVEINARGKVHLPQHEYQKLQRARADVIKLLMEKESEIGAINDRRVELNTIKEVRKRQAGELAPERVRKLVEMRDRWHGFSMDPINHQKAREVAWKFSQELRDFLKPVFQPAE